jgi:hypothetical protein
MLDRDALGHSGRSGRVNDVRQITGCGDRLRIVCRTGLEILDTEGRADVCRHLITQAALGKHDRCFGVLNHESETVAGIGDIERQIGRARLEDSEDAHDHIQGALEEETDNHIGAGTAARKWQPPDSPVH